MEMIDFTWVNSSAELIWGLFKEKYVTFRKFFVRTKSSSKETFVSLSVKRERASKEKKQDGH